MSDIDFYSERVKKTFQDKVDEIIISHNEITLVVEPEDLHKVCLELRDHDEFRFEQLIDICGVDYLHYGYAEWVGASANNTGFDRAASREQLEKVIEFDKPRFAVVYHLLSIEFNQRIRLKVYLPESSPIIRSVVDIWPSANWFERETFDLFGILFDNHPDLRRILTDYGFVGHPFRKDFPLSGEVEVRYDATKGRVVYEPVDIEPRVLVPKVIRKDSRYTEGDVPEEEGK